MMTNKTRYQKKRSSSKKTLKNKNKVGKNWVTAIEAAQKTLNKTGNYVAARKSLRKQALTNARKLFGSITSSVR
jgi:viroplasmin and RNaseH domain-containing protein